jgi:hemerythrin-like domain-containing protein
MRASEVRAELLEQHAELRAMAGGLTQVAARARSGEPVESELSSALVRFIDALRRHNLREEELLRDILPAVDAWGPARDQVMTEEHVEEHEELYAALFGLRTAPGEFAGEAAGNLMNRILEHMAREELIFLGDDTLRDERDGAAVVEITG